jgi:co-chaperonin GroES (HSP10)
MNTRPATLRPLGKNILLKPADKPKETTSAGGLVLPAGEKTATLRGEVLSLGREINDATCGFKVGDAVLYERNAPTTDVAGLLVVHVDHIVAVLA